MDRPDRAVTRLGEEVAALADASPAATFDVAAGKARQFAKATLPSRRRRASPIARLAWLAAAALVIGVVLSITLFAARRPPLAFEVEGGQGRPGTWIAATPSAETAVKFSDGSLLRVAPRGRARVVALDVDGAEVALERGTLALAVVHRPSTRWRVDVGPFSVRVVGTRFTTSWDPTAERFSVALEEGAILVSGPIVGEGRAVKAGERLTVSPATGELAVDRLEPLAVPEARAATSAAPFDARGDEAAAEAPSSARAPIGASPGSAGAAPRAAASWRDLARAAKYKDALAAAEASGFDAILHAANAADLAALADAARLAGDARRAEQASNALLDRFPSSAEAGDTMFTLGRVAQDQRHDRGAATAWFERYLREHPAGRFAEESSGRLIELAESARDTGAAKAAAERYLAGHPSGPYAGFARRVLERAAP